MSSRMSDEDVLALAQVAGLSIDPAHLPVVASNLAILCEQAEILAAASVTPQVEPAPVFRP